MRSFEHTCVPIGDGGKTQATLTFREQFKLNTKCIIREDSGDVVGPLHDGQAVTFNILFDPQRFGLFYSAYAIQVHVVERHSPLVLRYEDERGTASQVI